MIKKIEIKFTDETGKEHAAFLQLLEGEDPGPDPEPEPPPEEGGDPVAVHIKPDSWDFNVGDIQVYRAIAVDDQGRETQWPEGTEFLWDPRASRNDVVKVSEDNWTPNSIVNVTAVKAGTTKVVVSTRGPVGFVSKPGANAIVAGEVEEPEEPDPIPEPPPPSGGTNVTPTELMSVLGPIQLLSKDSPEFAGYNAGVEKGIKHFMSTYASGQYSWRNGSAQQNNPHYGTLRRVVYWCLRHGKPLDPTKVPELAAAIDVIGQAAKNHFESGSLNQQMFKTTHAIDFVLFVWFKQNAPAGSNDEYLRKAAEAYIWSNAAAATSWAEDIRVQNMDHGYYSGGREFAQELELWRCAVILNSPYRTYPGSSSRFFNFGSWQGNMQEQLKNGNLLLDKIAARFTGPDPKGMEMVDGEWRVASHARTYIDPTDPSLGTKLTTPYPIAVFMAWMVIHQAIAIERTLGISGGFDLGKRVATPLVRYYRQADRAFPYLTHFVGAPVGGDNIARDLNMFAPASLVRLEEAGLLTGGRALALDLVRGAATAGGFGWRWKQDQELASTGEGPCTSALLNGLS